MIDDWNEMAFVAKNCEVQQNRIGQSYLFVDRK